VARTVTEQTIIDILTIHCTQLPHRHL